MKDGYVLLCYHECLPNKLAVLFLQLLIAKGLIVLSLIPLDKIEWAKSRNFDHMTDFR